MSRTAFSPELQMLYNFYHRLRSSLPAACIVCGQAAGNDYSICRDCEGSLPSCGDSCSRCGVDFGGAPSQDSCCKRCLRSPPSFTTCKAAFGYVTPIDRLVAQFKFSARFDVGYALARVLADAFNRHYGNGARPELLLPVPLHPCRLRCRGFNQAREVSSVLSKYCHVATSNCVLRKIRNTEAQTTVKSAAARKGNLRGAFALHELGILRNVTHIALVDDVVTTMATVETISKLLQAQQPCRIDVWCLARASR